MKYIDAERFSANLLQLEETIKPSDEELKDNHLMDVYWKQ